MLQQTSRLRDALERQGGFTATDDHARGKALPFVTEAELVAPSGIFPNEFRWEALRSYCKTYTLHSGQMTVDRTKTNIDVLWLSPTVFLSPLHISVLDDQEVGFPFRRVFYDCTVDFLLRGEENGDKSVMFRAYSLSSLLDGDREEPSLLPFQFFQHVTALLPADYFSTIILGRVDGAPERCPSDHLLQFLAVIPNGSVQEATAVGGCTNVVIWGGYSITRDELQAILSHPFHPSVQLGFDEHPFRGELPEFPFLGLPLIEMLKEARCLRSVQIPCQVLRSYRGETPVFELSARSSNLMMHASNQLWPCQFDTIATIHDVDAISIKSYVRDSEDQKNVFNQCITPFLNGGLKTKSLRIHLRSDPGVHLPESQAQEWAGALSIPHVSKDLTMFNVWFYPVFKHQPQNLGGMKEWDAELFPSLVLNYCGENVLQPLDEELLPSAVQLINQGSVYHKTTGHKAFDMGTTNAGLIFALLRIKAGETQGLGDGFSRKKATSPPRKVISSLSGTKRPAPSLDSDLAQD
jgi:hypothetical protein